MYDYISLTRTEPTTTARILSWSIHGERGSLNVYIQWVGRSALMESNISIGIAIRRDFPWRSRTDCTGRSFLMTVGSQLRIIVRVSRHQSHGRRERGNAFVRITNGTGETD